MMIVIIRKPVFRNYFFRAVLVAVVVFVAVRAGLILGVSPYYSSPIWPAFGLAVGFGYLFGIWTIVPAILSIFAGFYFHNYFAVELFVTPMKIALTMTVLSGILILFKTWVIRKVLKNRDFLQRPVEVGLFILIIVALSVLTYAALTSTLLILDEIPGTVARHIFIAWTGADLTGCLVFIPLVVSCSGVYSHKPREGGYPEYLLIITVLVSMFFFILLTNRYFGEKLSFFLLPFFFWIAFRYTMRDAAIALMVLSFLATYTAFKNTPMTYSKDEFFYTFYVNQLYLFFVAPVFLLVNAYSTHIRTELRQLLSEKKLTGYKPGERIKPGAYHVTRSEAAEADLRWSDEKFGSFFDNTSAIILIIDPVSGVIESANRAALDFYGFDTMELGKINFGTVSQLSGESVNEYMEGILNGHRRSFSMRHIIRNGNEKHVEVYPSPVRIEGKTLLFAIIQDITRRKKAIAALKESESKKLALLKIIPDLIYIINRRGIILDVYTDRPSALIMPPDKMLGKKFVDILPEELRNMFTDTIRAAFADRDVKSFEYSFHRNEIVLYEEARFIVSGFDEMLVIIRDISNLKRGEIELKKAWEEAEKANSAKSVFLANISHEIRTPINAVIGFTELLGREISEPRHESYVNSIKASSRTLLSLIEDILDISKIEANSLDLKPGLVDIRLLVEEVRDMFILRMEEKKLGCFISIPVSIPEKLYLDELRVKQILINLVSNAVKFTEEGKIGIEIFAQRQVSAGEINYLDLQIDVSDTGIGIPKEFQHVIFEVFKQQEEQDSRKYGGTGLGLAITSRLVELMNGNIVVNSTPGTGSKFSVTIPGVATDIIIYTLNRKEKPLRNQIRFRNANILIADDVITNRELLRGIIKGEDLYLADAADGKEAIELLNNQVFDVVLLDLNMPKVSGYEVAEFIRSNEMHAQTIIIAISAAQIPARESHRATSFNYFLTKPISVKELIFILARHISYYEAGKSGASSEMQEPAEEILGKVTEYSHLDKTEIEKLRVDLDLIKETSSFSEIMSYAKQISLLAKSNNLSNLKNIAIKIEKAAENFDIEEIQKQFTRLSSIFKNMNYGAGEHE